MLQEKIGGDSLYAALINILISYEFVCNMKLILLKEANPLQSDHPFS